MSILGTSVMLSIRKFTVNDILKIYKYGHSLRDLAWSEKLWKTAICVGRIIWRKAVYDKYKNAVSILRNLQD